MGVHPKNQPLSTKAVGLKTPITTSFGDPAFTSELEVACEEQRRAAAVGVEVQRVAGRRGDRAADDTQSTADRTGCVQAIAGASRDGGSVELNRRGGVGCSSNGDCRGATAH